MTETMRAVICESYRDYDDLEIMDVPVPGPIGAEDVRIAIKVSGVSWATTLMVAGKYQRKLPTPFAPGAEVAGEVLEAGAESGFRAGQRVFAVLDFGGYAEQVVVHARHVFEIPEGRPMQEGVPVPMSWMTAYGGLVWRAGIKPGDKVMVHGAAGGVGLPAMEIARVMGCETFAVVRGEAKAAYWRAAGADHVIDSTHVNFRDYVAEATGGRGVDVVYDTVGGEVLHRSLRCLADDGRHVVIGFVGGDIAQVPSNILLLKNISVCGLNMGQYVGWGVVDERARFAPMYRAGVAQLTEWWAEGRIAPKIHAALPLERFREAMGLVTGREAIGRVVLTL